MCQAQVYIVKRASQRECVYVAITWRLLGKSGQGVEESPLWENGNESLVYGGKESGYRGLYEILEWTLHRNLALAPAETTVLRSCLASRFPFSFGYQVAQSKISNCPLPLAPAPATLPVALL